MIRPMLSGLRMLVVLTVLTGVIYPILVTGLAQLLFPEKANGSLLKSGDAVIGSELVGQKFSSDHYFHSRPSAVDYNPLPSGGSNLGSTSNALRDKISERAGPFQPSRIDQIPSDLLTASASGLDPHLSPEGARYQVTRVLAARGIELTQRHEVELLIQTISEKPQFGVFGMERVNILKLNIALDSIFP